MSSYDDDLLDEEDEEMPLTERDLADDAQWKIIQKNTFTRWANEHLKTINKNITELEGDLSDGLRLVGLVEVLSGKKFKFVNKRPNFRTQKLENVTMALEFLEKDEGIRIVNIDSGDIVDSKLKLILGLIWTLILHYSISMPMWEGEEPQPQEGGPTPKQRLLNWIGAKVPDLPIKNFTTDWNNGKAIGALVDAVAPGLCPDWEDWDPKKAKKNAKEAMDAAEEWLDVPQLIRPEEMTNPKVDDLSMMTYLSQFPKAKLKPGAPIRPKQNAQKVRAYGKGVEPKGNTMGAPAKFTVETFSAGAGTVEVNVIDPKGKNVKCEIVFNNDRTQTYSCVYIPPIEGDYRVIVKFGEKEISKSPFKVNVGAPLGDPSKVSAAGPGLEKTGVSVSKKTYFEVFTKGRPSQAGVPGKLSLLNDAGKGQVDVVIVDPNDKKDTVKPAMKPINKDGVYYVEYTATIQGLHSINILFNGQPIPNSPYAVHVGPAINPKAVYATGRGIQPRGVRVKQTAEFKVHTKDAGVAEVKVQIIGPGGANIDCKVVPSKTEEGVYECVYIPPKVGQYVINITFGGQHITKSPFRVDVGPEKFSKIVAFGPGLEGGVVNQPACFTVETNGETGALGFSIEGPSQAKIDCKDNGDGSADITYWPTIAGEYAIHILCNDEDIPQAPYMAQIQPATNAFDASKVIAKGPGLEPTGVVINKQTEFTVDAKKAGKAPLNVTCIDETYKAIEVTVKDNKDGTYLCKYTPKQPIKHTIIITWGTVSIPKSPFRVYVTEPVNPGNVKVFGPGVEKGVKTFVVTHFTVDCKTAGPGDVAISLTDEKGQDVPVNTIDNNDGTFTVEYEPKTPGVYTVSVFFAEKPVPKTPIKVKVESSIDLSKVTVKGLETPIKLGEKRIITVVTKLAIKKDAPCTIIISMPSGKQLEMTLKLVPDGYTTEFVPTEVGKHTVTVTYAMQAVPKSPFTVMVEIPVDVGKVKVSGLESPIPLGHTRKVSIITMGLPKKDAPCKVSVTSPKNKTVQLPVKKSPEGYTTDFKPTEEGPHKVEVTYDSKAAPDSPFTVQVVPAPAKMALVEVKGLEKPIQVGENRPVTVCVSKSAPKRDAPCTVKCTTPSGNTVELPLKKVPEGYGTTLTPQEPGPHKVEATFDAKPVPQSPFTVEVYPKGGKPKGVPAAAAPPEITVLGLDTPIQTGEKRVIKIIIKKPISGASCKISSTNPKGRASALKIQPSSEGFEATFTPWDTGVHKVVIEYNSKPVPGSPFDVEVYKVNIAAVTVKGLEKPIPVGETRPIQVITKDAGKPDLPCSVAVTSPKGQTTELPTEKNPEGYTAPFTPEEPGDHKVKVLYAAKEVPKSPFTAKVEPSKIKPEKIVPAQKAPPTEAKPASKAPQEPKEPITPEIIVKGLETPVQTGEKRVIKIIIKKPISGASCKISSTNPKGRASALKIQPSSEGFEATFTPWDTGVHKVVIEYNSKPVPGSPFDVEVYKINISAVTVKGLEKPIPVGETRPIQVITKDAGKPDLPCSVAVTSPKGQTTELPTEKNPEGYTAPFTPEEPGDHKVKVLYAAKEVPKSPFTAKAEPSTIKPLKKTPAEEKAAPTGAKPASKAAPEPKEPTTPEIIVKGLETPVQTGEKRVIKIIIKKPISGAPCKISSTNPKGRASALKIQPSSEGFEAIFTPWDSGVHKVVIEYNSKPVPGSPFDIEVYKVNIAAVTVKGLEKPIPVGETRPIQVVTKDTGKPDLPCSVAVTSPKGQTTELPTEKNPEGYTAPFTPEEPGDHKVKVLYAAKEVPKSPFTAKAEPSTIKPLKKAPVEEKVAPTEAKPASKAAPESKEPTTPEIIVKGLETPIQTGEKRVIKIIIKKPISGASCKISSTNPKGRASALKIQPSSEGFEAIFTPWDSGVHKVVIEYNSIPVTGSPFDVEVFKVNIAAVTVKGLEKPIPVGETRPIQVITKDTGKPDLPCSVAVTSPKGQTTELPTEKNPEGYTAPFTPEEPGDHKVKVQYAAKEVPKSPFTAKAEPSTIKPLKKAPVEEKVAPTEAKPASKAAPEPKEPTTPEIIVKGLETPIQTGEKRVIKIIIKKPISGAPCKISSTNPKGRASALKIQPSSEGFEATFTPWDTGVHKVVIEYNSKPVSGSPFDVEVFKSNIAAVTVKGLEKPIPIGETRPIQVVTKDAGKPDLPCSVAVTSPKGQTTELPTEKNPEGYTAPFTPEEPGVYKVKVLYSAKEVPKSPFTATVEPLAIKPEKIVEAQEQPPTEAKPASEAAPEPTIKGEIIVKGLDTPVNAGEKRPVIIDTTNVLKKGATCKVTMANPKGRPTELKVKPNTEGYETTFFSWDKGDHMITVEYDGEDIPDCPMKVIVQKIDVAKVTVTGLDTPIELGETRMVSINTSETGAPDAPCSVNATSPKGENTEIPVEKNPEGYQSLFTPTEKGDHKVKIMFAGKELPKSPFKVPVKCVDVSGVIVKGLERPVMVGEKRYVAIVTTSTGKKDHPCKVQVTNPKGAVSQLFTSPNPEGYETYFEPTDLGVHKVKVEVAQEEVPGSEFKVEVTKFEEKVEVQGLETPILAGEKRMIKILAAAPAKPNKFAPPPSCKVLVTNPKNRHFEPKVDRTVTGFETSYSSNEPGPHVFKIEHNGKEIPISPITVEVEKLEIRKVQVNGLDEPIEVGETRPIEIITVEAGKADAPCKVLAVSPKGDTQELPTKQIPDGYETSYAPLEVGPHKVKVEYATKELPKSPYPVEVKPKSKGAPKEAPKEVPKEAPIEPVKVAPKKAAPIEAPIEPVKQAPKEAAPKEPPKDVPVTVKGLETPVTVGEKRPITVVSSMPDAPCKVTATNPKGKESDIPTKKIPNGQEALFAPLEEGPYKVKVEHNGKEVPKSPFSVEVKPKFDISKVQVKGLETPVKAGESRPIDIITKSTGKPDAPCKITAKNPLGKENDLPAKKVPDGYQAVFAPLEPGPHVVKVEVDNKEVPKSPFTVPVELDLKKVSVKGLEKPVTVNEVRAITVLTKGTADEAAHFKVVCTTPSKTSGFLPVKKVPEGYEATFNPKEKGKHRLNMELAGNPLPDSPFMVNVEEKFDIKKVVVKGLEKPIPLGESRPIIVNTASAGKPDTPCTVMAKGPSTPYEILPAQTNEEGFICTFTPKEVGPNYVKVEFAEKEVPGSPFHVKVEPAETVDVAKVEIKGLEHPIEVGEPRPVQINTAATGKPDAPCRVIVTTPKGQLGELPVQQTPEGYTTTFAPLEPGPHKVNVNFNNQDVPKSPFPVNVTPKANVGAVTVKGLETPIEVGEPRPISINTSSTGKPDAPCEVLVTTPAGKVGELPTKKAPEGYTTTFAPLEPGPHVVNVKFDKQEVPKSPFNVNVEPKANVGAVTVKGLETPIEVGEPRPISINTASTGKPDAPCRVLVKTPQGQLGELPTQKTPEGYGTTFAPLEPGPHVVSVQFANEEVPKSPFPVNVEPKANVGAVTVKGLETPIEVGEPRPISINTASTGKPDAPCRVLVKTPQGQLGELPTQKTPEGYGTTFAPLEPGQHVVSVQFANEEVPKSPFPVNVEPKANVGAVTVKGLETPIEVGEPRPISINTASTGKPDAPCRVLVKTPQGQLGELPTQKTPEGYGTTFAPLEPGPHVVSVQFANEEVPKSPFQVDVEPKANVNAVTVKGLETPIEVGEPRPISINTASTGKPDAPCRVLVKTPQGQLGELPTQKTPEGYGTTFAPLEPGPHVVSVQFANEEVPKSPFPVNVEPKANVGAVTVKGLETPIEVGEPRPISINTASTGKPDAPCRVIVATPDGQMGELPTQKTPEGYATTFAPLSPGPHQVSVTFADQEVPRSPFQVQVEPRPNVNAVTVKGLETPLTVNEPRPILIDTTSTGRPDAPCRVAVTNPVGQSAELPLQQVPEGFETLLAPLEPGPHLVHVDFDNQPVPYYSPYSLNVEPQTNLDAIQVLGLDTPIEVDEARPIQINTTATGKPDAPCRVTAVNPQGQVFELPAQKTPEGYQTVFAPVEQGPHKVNVNFAGKEVPKSPFNVNVEPKVDIGAVEVMGLETPIKVGEPRPVTIMTSTTGKPDAPCRVLVTKPTGQTMELPTRKIPEGYTATLAPQEVGPHKVNVEFNGKEVPKSPFNVMAEPAIDFNKVKVSGLEAPIEVGEIRPVTVDTAECGVVDAPCQMTSTNPAGQVREVPIQKTPTGYVAQFAPLEEGPHQVAVKYAGKEVPKSPFPVQATPAGPPASKVKAYGPGLETGMATKPCQFTIDTREVTKPGGIGVTVEGPAESKIECRDNQDGTCEVTYFPTIPGDYNVNVTYADEHIPKSPYTAKIVPSGDIDVSGVKAYGPGLEPNVFLDSPTGFTVDAKSVAPKGEGKVRAIVTSPSGQKTESLVKNNDDGTYDVLYTPYEQGTNTLDITYENCPIPQSPVKVDAAPGSDASRVKAYGPGLEGGVTDAKQKFTVDVRGAGQGGLALAIDGPAETQINCKDNRDGTCEVEYMPVKKGDYDITVKFADQHVPGSPFKVPVKDEVNPSKVKCYGPGLDSNLVKAHEPATFTVDSTEAGEAPIEVKFTDSTGAERPAEIQPIEPGKAQVTYTPVDEGKCKVDVKFANQSVPNSPFNVNVQPGVDASKVRLSGDGIKPTVLASMPVQFVIDTRDAGVAELDVVIQRPDGSYIRPMIEDNGDGTYTVKYTPEDCGVYNISITFGGKPVTEAPIKTTAVPTGDAAKCRITDGLQQTIPVEKETVISVDASQAGTGKVTCRIRSPTGTEIDIDIVENVDGTFSILFKPAFPGDYSISIKFGGQTIPEGDYIIQAVSDAAYQDYLSKLPPVGEDLITPDTVDSTQAAAPGAGLYQPQEFRLPVGPIFNFVTAYVKMPSGKKAYPKIEDNKDGTVTLRYQPQETGLHELHLCYNQTEVPGSPFQFHVDAINSGHVTAYGPGLSHGVVNQPAQFTIVTKDAGAGGLSLAIEGPSKTEIKCKDNEDGTCTVTYLPTAPGEYNITVKFADKNISGSPFVSKVTAGEPKQKAQIGRSSEVSLKVTETDITNLTASIRSPSGQEEPCMLKRLPNGHLGISFTPRETGEHLVNVFRDGQHIANSPFKIVVGESELGNAGKVKVYGKGLEEGMANEVNEFIVDTRDAGYGGLSLSIEGPSKADIECHDNEDGTCRVTYKPTEPGTYIINIKFADEHVPSSPFKVKIGGEPSERITERIMRHREAADVTHVGSECELSLKIPGTSPFDMTASVTSPNGVTELCDVVNLDDCHYSIKFVPKEMGIHTVSVKHKDMHIPGSPFQFTVGPIAGGGAHKVHAAGLGLVRGEVEQPNEFNIYTREAGAGGLSIAVEGPSKAEVDFEDRKDGSCGVSYSVTEPGEYLVSIKFNDEHIPESPFRVPISPSIGDARKISVSALQHKGLTVGKPCAFVVNFNGAPKGKLMARVVSPSGAEDNALVQEIDDGEYAVRFIPRENGPHLVYVSFDGCQIPDSPFRVQVGTVNADPGMVQAYGDGLRTGKTGVLSKFIVNTVNAGSGALAVTVEGPSKVKLECAEVSEGYEFSYTPTAPGDYLITIKYAGTNIAGSPYKARVEGQGRASAFQEQASVVVETVTKTSVMSKFASLPPFQSDASKVTADGNGLKKGYRNKQCTFSIDASQAGNNMLFIGMIGPKGPCEELCVKHNPGLPYKINYLVKERGDYMLAVKWGEDHIPGSPFYVRVD